MPRCREAQPTEAPAEDQREEVGYLPFSLSPPDRGLVAAVFLVLVMVPAGQAPFLWVPLGSGNPILFPVSFGQVANGFSSLLTPKASPSFVDALHLVHISRNGHFIKLSFNSSSVLLVS